MKLNKTGAFLKCRGVNITSPRKEVLAVFMGSNRALSQKDIYDLVGPSFDRVTIYRTLELFVSKGIIHVVPSMTHQVHYALEQPEDGGGCFQNHLHFICMDCGKIVCLNTVPVPLISLPAGFSWQATEVIVKGTCNNCAYS